MDRGNKKDIKQAQKFIPLESQGINLYTVMRIVDPFLPALDPRGVVLLEGEFWTYD